MGWPGLAHIWPALWEGRVLKQGGGCRACSSVPGIPKAQSPVFPSASLCTQCHHHPFLSSLRAFVRCSPASRECSGSTPVAAQRVLQASVPQPSLASSGLLCPFCGFPWHRLGHTPALHPHGLVSWLSVDESPAPAPPPPPLGRLWTAVAPHREEVEGDS